MLQGVLNDERDDRNLYDDMESNRNAFLAYFITVSRYFSDWQKKFEKHYYYYYYGLTWGSQAGTSPSYLQNTNQPVGAEVTPLKLRG
jgi:hypothetical protein